ncbi:hypothetical protein Tco_0613270 [Tanacetum coccineum]
MSNISGCYKIDENVEAEVDDEAEIKKLMEIVQNDEVKIDTIPLATMPPVIVEWKIIKEGNMGHYQLIRADGSSKRYSSMIQMLQDIDREDIETLWKLVKAKHGNTRLEEAYERVLWGDLKVMFEPDVESEIWRTLQGYKVTVWKLFSSCRVHFVRFQNLHIFMLDSKALSSSIEILGETIPQEDMNLKFLRSLPSEWKTHTLIWRNKPDLDTLRMDDLYNNLKIYETEVKGHQAQTKITNVGFVSLITLAVQASLCLPLNNEDYNRFLLRSGKLDLKWQCYVTREPKILNKTGRKINANGLPRGEKNTNLLKKDLQTLHLWHIHLQALQVLQAQILSEGYHVVPPPYTGNFIPSKYALVLADEEEYVLSNWSVGEPLIEDWISDSEDENETEFKSKQRKPSFAKIEFVKSNEHVKTPRESVKKVENKKQAKYPRKNSQSPKAAVSVNTARPINTAYPRPTVNSARRVSNVFNRAHSHVRRPFNNSTTNKNSNLKEKVNIVKGNVTTAGPKAVLSQMLDKKNIVLLLTLECVVLSPDIKLLDENHVCLEFQEKIHYRVEFKENCSSGVSLVSLQRRT